MQPQFIKQDSLNSLLASFDEAKTHYMSNDKDWFTRRLTQERGLRDTRFTFPNFQLSQGNGEATEEEYELTDSENTRIIYEAMRNLPLATAADKRFWSGLAHTECWDYIQYRRKNEIASGRDIPIKTSYFFTNGVKRSAHVHCLSRLWWAGRLTYDEENKTDPYALTDLLTGHSFASRIVLLSSSNFTANKRITLGILDAIKEQSEMGILIRREHFVGATKYLNRMGAIRVLDFLNRNQVKAIVAEYYATEAFADYKLT